MRHTFGGDLSAYTMGLGTEETTTVDGQSGPPGIVLSGQLVTFWDSQYDGQQYTDLLTATTGGPDDPGGQAITSVYTSDGTDPAGGAYGSIPMFLGPDGVAYMWAQIGTTIVTAPGPTASAYGMGEYGDGLYVGADEMTGDDGGSGVEDPDPGDDIPPDDDVIDDDDPVDDPVDDEEPDTGDPGDVDDPGDETPTTATGVLNSRLLIVASTSGWVLRDELQAATAGLEPRVDTLEAQATDTGTHLGVVDQQIAALQSAGGGTGGQTAIGTGPTDERPDPAAGTMYYDTELNQLWVTVTAVAAGTLVWAPIPGSLVYTARQTSQQQLNDGTAYPITFDTVDVDLIGSAVTGQPTRFQPTVPGVYSLDACVSFSGNSGAHAGSVRYLQWRLNGGTVAAATTATIGSESYTTTANARRLSAYFNGNGDYADLVAYHNAGVTISTAITAWGQSTITVTYQGGSGA